jgi:hypothetical protein
MRFRVSCLVSLVSCLLSPLVAARADDDDAPPPPPVPEARASATPTLADLQRAIDAATRAAQAAEAATAALRAHPVSASPQTAPEPPSFSAALVPAKATPEPAPQPVAAALAAPATVVTTPAPTLLVRQAAPTVLVSEAPAPTVVYVREAPAAPAPVRTVYVREAAPEPPTERVVYVRESVPRRPVVATARGTALVEPCCLRRAAGRFGEKLTRIGYEPAAEADEAPPPPAPVYAAQPSPSKRRPFAALPPLASPQR